MTQPIPENTPALIPGSVRDTDIHDMHWPKIDWNLAPFTPPAAPTAAAAGAGAGNVDNGEHSVAVTFVNGAGETTLGTATDPVAITNHSTDGKIAISVIPTGPAGTTARKVYATKANTTEPFHLVDTISDNTTTTYTYNTADASLGAEPPTENGTAAPPYLSGALSAVTDAAAKDVLTSMAAAFVALGAATDGTS